MRRGEIWLAVLGPVVGSEADKTRPVVIVSNNGVQAAAERLGRGVVTVVPVTSNVRSVYPFQVLLPRGGTGLDVDWKAQAEQVRSIDYVRLRHRLGSVSEDLMDELDVALRLHLAL